MTYDLIILLCTIFAVAALLDSNSQIYSSCNTKEAESVANCFRFVDRDNSNCPVEKWFEVMASEDIKIKNHGVFINIGVNKGYNFANWIDLFLPWTNVDASAWFSKMEVMQLFRRSKDNFCPPCGCCGDCGSKFHVNYSSSSSIAVGKPANFLFVGVDLNKGNLHGIQQIVDSLSDNIKNQVSFLLLHAAGAAEKGVIRIPICDSGSESCRIPDNSDTDTNVKYENVPAETIDDLIHNLISNHSHKHPQLLDLYKVLQAKHISSELNSTVTSSSSNSGLIDIIQIDTEGHDALVLRGGAHIFKHRAVRCIIFEYHSFHPWNTLKLQESVRDLHEYGYDCFFMGNERLWPISDQCWHDIYEFHHWSNVLCILRGDIWHRAVYPYVVERDKKPHEFPEGSIIQPHNSRAVYLIQDNKTHLFNNGKAFMSRGYDFEKVSRVDAFLLCFREAGDTLF